MLNRAGVVAQEVYDGADSCLEEGVEGILSAQKEIYLPWEGFNNKSKDYRGYIDTPKMSNYPEAQLIAERLHPNWGVCSRGVKALHTRNIYEILGKDLNTPSKFVLLYAQPTDENGNVKGGTGQAVRLALEYNIPIRNLWYQSVVDNLEEWLKEL